MIEATTEAASEAASEATIEQLNTRGETLRNEITHLFKISGVPGQVTGAGSLFRIHLHSRPIRNYRDTYLHEAERTAMVQLQQNLLNAGVYLSANGFGCLSTAMTETDLEQFSNALLRSLQQMKNKHPSSNDRFPSPVTVVVRTLRSDDD